MSDIASFIELLHQRLAERRRHRGEVVLSEAEVQTAVDLLSSSHVSDEVEKSLVLETALDAAHAEIERLRADLDLDYVRKSKDEARAEIERLLGKSDSIERDDRAALAIGQDRLQAELRELDLKPKKPKVIKQQP